MRYTLYIALGLVLFAMGCRPGKIADPDSQQEDTASATDMESDTDSQTDSDTEPEEETDTEEEDPRPDTGDTDDTGDKPEDTGSSDLGECGADFDPEESCEGSWEETLCSHEGMMWWCQDAVWMNEDDKPE